MSNTQTSLLKSSRWKPWEPVLWLIAFAAPVLMPSHASLINEIAIVALFAVSPCISPSTSSSGARWRTSSSAARIFCADSLLEEPKFECDSRAARGTRPKRFISSAAMMVMAASSLAFGFSLTWVSTMHSWRSGSTRMFIAAYTQAPGRRPSTWSM